MYSVQATVNDLMGRVLFPASLFGFSLQLVFESRLLQVLCPFMLGGFPENLQEAVPRGLLGNC